jgi:hypothetical protein
LYLKLNAYFSYDNEDVNNFFFLLFVFVSTQVFAAVYAVTASYAENQVRRPLHGWYSNSMYSESVITLVGWAMIIHLGVGTVK